MLNDEGLRHYVLWPKTPSCIVEGDCRATYFEFDSPLPQRTNGTQDVISGFCRDVHFPGSWVSYSLAKCIAVELAISAVCLADFSFSCSAGCSEISWKLQLCCGFHFPCFVLALRVVNNYDGMGLDEGGGLWRMTVSSWLEGVQGDRGINLLVLDLGPRCRSLVSPITWVE